MINGVDISNHQGKIDWRMVANNSDVQFGITKSSEGDYYFDQTCPYNIWRMRDFGILPAVYHFANPVECKALDEADYFLNNVGKNLLKGDVAFLDLEESYGQALPSDTDSWVTTWFNEVDKGLGFPCHLYTNTYILGHYDIVSIPNIKNKGLWLASPGTVMPKAPHPWDFIAWWQNSWEGSVSGIVGKVDLDKFNGTIDRMPLYGKP